MKYKGVYPGVDLVYYGNQRQLEYDFVVAPGADPILIVLDVGAVREPPTVTAVSDRRSAAGTLPLQKRAHRDAPLQIAADGDLVLEADGGEIRFHKPVVYQKEPDGLERTTDHGHRTPVQGQYILTAENQIHFALGAYDHTRPQVIDPVLSYATYLGGAIAVDAAGSAYVTGYAESSDFPTSHPLQASYGGFGDAFVTKLNPTGIPARAGAWPRWPWHTAGRATDGPCTPDLIVDKPRIPAIRRDSYPSSIGHFVDVQTIRLDR